MAIDGKTARRSDDSRTGRSAIHLVNAWASANRLVVGQVKVDDKSNEITAIPKLLRMLEVSGCIVTIDSMGCHKEIASTIIERGADYALSLKRNQGQLHDDVVEMFEYGRQTDFADMVSDWFETVEKGHGRVETRRGATISSPEFISYLDDRGRWLKPEECSFGGVRAQHLWECVFADPLLHIVSVGRRRANVRGCSWTTGEWRTRCIGYWTYRLGRTLAE